MLEKERDQEQEEHQGLERGSKRPRIGKLLPTLLLKRGAGKGKETV